MPCSKRLSRETENGPHTARSRKIRVRSPSGLVEHFMWADIHIYAVYMFTEPSIPARNNQFRTSYKFFRVPSLFKKKILSHYAERATYYRFNVSIIKIQFFYSHFIDKLQEFFFQLKLCEKCNIVWKFV